MGGLPDCQDVLLDHLVHSGREYLLLDVEYHELPPVTRGLPEGNADVPVVLSPLPRFIGCEEVLGLFPTLSGSLLRPWFDLREERLS